MGDSQERDSRLRDWRDVDSGQRLVFWSKGFLAMALVVLACAFFVFVLKPFDTTSLRIVAIALDANSTVATDLRSDKVIPPGNAARQAGIRSLSLIQDVAGRLQTVQFDDASQLGNTAQVSNSGVKNPNQTWIRTLRSDIKQPQLIYLGGSVEISHGEAFLVPSTSDPEDPNQRIEIRLLLRNLGASSSPSIVLLDIFEPRETSIGMLPELEAWQLKRCVDREINQIPGAKLAVIVHHTEFDALTRGEEFVSSLTRKLISGFSPDADTNGDHVIAADELIRRLTHVSGKRRTGATGTLFSSIEPTQWREIPLVPAASLGPAVPESAQPAAVAEKSPSETVASRNEIDSLVDHHETVSSIQKIAVTAPTLALARQMQEAGIQTLDGEKAAETLATLQSWLAPDSPKQAAVQWLASPPLASATWDEIFWMKTVIQHDDAPWPLQQDLIRCRVNANRLAIEPTARDWSGDRWRSVQWKRLDAERSFISPVRRDAQQHVREKLKDALSAYERIDRETQTIISAKRICKDILVELDGLFSVRIHARSTADDVVCQLLTEANNLQDWISQKRTDGIHEGQMMVDLVSDLHGAVSQAMPQPNALKVDDDFVAKTRIRVARSALAAQLILSSDLDDSAKAISPNVQTVFDRTIDVLSNRSSSESQIQEATGAFRMAMEDLKPQLHRDRRNWDADDLPDRVESRRWASVLRSLAQDTRELASDSTAVERKQLLRANNRCQRLALALGQDTLERVNEDFKIVSVMRGSLAVSDHAVVEIKVVPLTDSALPGRLQIELDQTAISVQQEQSAQGEISLFDSKDLLTQGEYQATAVQRLTQQASQSSNPASSIQRRSLSTKVELHRIASAEGKFEHPDSAINLRWVTRDDVYRASVPVQMPLPDVANVWFASDPASPVGGNDVWTTHANRDTHRRLIVDTYDASTRTVQVRLIAWPDGSIAVPPPMTVDQSKRWYSTNPTPSVLASHPDVSVEQTTYTAVLFPPQPIDPLATPIPIGALWCEVTDQDRGIVQITDLSPRVFRPGALVQPSISYDAAAQVVSVDLESNQAVMNPSEKTHVEIQVVDQTTQRVVAKTNAVVPNPTVLGRDTKLLSVADCQGRPFRVRLAVDGWPSSFVYDFSGSETVNDAAQADGEIQLEIIHPTSPVIADRNTRTLDAHVWVDLGDDIFHYSADTITLGLDVNGDRYLIDEPSVSVSTPMGIGFTWSGVNDQGDVVLSCLAKPHRLSVPVDFMGSRRSALIAKLQRGSTEAWSRPLTVVFDSQPPKTKNVQIVSSLPAVLGAPIEAHVTIDDAGLSGAASLQAGWAFNGQLEFTPDVKPVAGQRLVDGRWVLVMPTDGLVSGVHTLLIQPTDAAGNIGAVKTTTIPVLSEAELEAARQRQATAVRGKVAYVTKPVAGIKMALIRDPPKSPEKEPNPPKNPGKSDDDTSLASNSTQQAQTDAEGNFVFPNVRAGDYRLELDGMYRGTRYQKVIRVAVQPPQPSDLSTIRID